MPTRGRFHNKPSHFPLDSPSYPSPTQDLVAQAQASRFRPNFSATAPSASDALHLQARIRFNPARGADKGAISQQTSPLPSDSLSYPSPTQDPVAPSKRTVVSRTEALRLRPNHCLTPSSKNQIQPSSGCRQGDDFTSNFATALRLSPLPVAHPKPHCSIKTSRCRSYGCATAPSL